MSRCGTSEASCAMKKCRQIQLEISGKGGPATSRNSDEFTQPPRTLPHPIPRTLRRTRKIKHDPSFHLRPCLSDFVDTSNPRRVPRPRAEYALRRCSDLDPSTSSGRRALETSYESCSTRVKDRVKDNAGGVHKDNLSTFEFRPSTIVEGTTSKR